MEATEFLISRNIIDSKSKDLIIGFDDGTEESLIELLESYYTYKNNQLKTTKK